MTNNGFDYGLAIHLDTYLPTLAEIKGWAQGDDEQALYFQQFGWGQLEVFPDCPRVQARMPDLQLLFEEKYAFRQVNRETMEQWQVSLQTKFDSYCRKMEYAYELRDRYLSKVSDSVGAAGRVTELHEGQDVSTVDNRQTYVDTPDSIVNKSLQYADSLTKDEGNRRLSYGHKITTTTDDDRDLSDKLSRTIDGYRDIDVEFINKFEDNFLNVFY